jgi:hypothetical protein
VQSKWQSENNEEELKSMPWKETKKSLSIIVPSALEILDFVWNHV